MKMTSRAFLGALTLLLSLTITGVATAAPEAACSGPAERAGVCGQVCGKVCKIPGICDALCAVMC